MRLPAARRSKAGGEIEDRPTGGTRWDERSRLWKEVEG